MNSLRVARNFLKFAYDFSSVQFDLPEDIAQEIYDWGVKNIPDEILTDDGREENIHVTCKYGLHTIDFSDLRNLFVGVKPVSVILGKISLFKSDDCDVIKIEVVSPELHRLNRNISSSFDVTDTHPIYIPHCTIAYVKRTRGNPYDGRKDFAGRKLLLDSVVFSGKDNRKTLFKLI